MSTVESRAGLNGPFHFRSFTELHVCLLFSKKKSCRTCPMTTLRNVSSAERRDDSRPVFPLTGQKKIGSPPFLLKMEKCKTEVETFGRPFRRGLETRAEHWGTADPRRTSGGLQNLAEHRELEASAEHRLKRNSGEPEIHSE